LSRISYPDAAHRARAHTLGVSPGGDIIFTGCRLDRRGSVPLTATSTGLRDAFAVTNEEIEEIWSVVPVGSPILIKP
jgi:hypothetical protein